MARCLPPPGPALGPPDPWGLTPGTVLSGCRCWSARGWPPAREGASGLLLQPARPAGRGPVCSRLSPARISTDPHCRICVAAPNSGLRPLGLPVLTICQPGEIHTQLHFFLTRQMRQQGFLPSLEVKAQALVRPESKSGKEEGIPLTGSFYTGGLKGESSGMVWGQF